MRWLAQLLSRLSIPRLAAADDALPLDQRGAGDGRLDHLARAQGRRRLSRQTRRERAARSQTAPLQAGPTELAFEDLQQAPPGERCVWLVRLLVQALRRSGRLSHESTLTYRELDARSRVFDDPAAARTL